MDLILKMSRNNTGFNPSNRGQVGEVLMMTSTGVMSWVNPERIRKQLDMVSGNRKISFYPHPTTQSYDLYWPKSLGKKGEHLCVDDHGFLYWKKIGLDDINHLELPHGKHNDPSLHEIATEETAGFMSSEDKKALSSLSDEVSIISKKLSSLNIENIHDQFNKTIAQTNSYFEQLSALLSQQNNTTCNLENKLSVLYDRDLELINQKHQEFSENLNLTANSLSSINDQLSILSQDNNSLQQSNQLLQQHLQESNQLLQQVQESNELLHQKLHHSSQTLQQLQEENKSLQQNFEQSKSLISTLSSELNTYSSLQKSYITLQEQFDTLQSQLSSLSSQLQQNHYEPFLGPLLSEQTKSDQKQSNDLLCFDLSGFP